MSHVNEELLLQLKQSASKRKQLDFAADLRHIRSLSRTQWMPCCPSVMMQCSTGSQEFAAKMSKQSSVSFVCLINMPRHLPGAKMLSSDAQQLVQKQPGLVCFSWHLLISFWTLLEALPLFLSARTMQALLSFYTCNTIRDTSSVEY